jgi:protein-L-isoaspartate(D-aspartate) O-methyltransferase
MKMNILIAVFWNLTLLSPHAETNQVINSGSTNFNIPIGHGLLIEPRAVQSQPAEPPTFRGTNLLQVRSEHVPQRTTRPAPGAPSSAPVNEVNDKVQSKANPNRRIDQNAIYKIARNNMVTNQLTTSTRGIAHQEVLKAMLSVPRHSFTPALMLADAYEDKAVEINKSSAMQSPYVVAAAAEQLDPKPTDRVLELGTGSGYQSAVLSCLVKEVYSVEPESDMATCAQVDLYRLGYTNVFVKNAQIAQGWPDAGPFDAIIANVGLDTIPVSLSSQLKPGGRIIIPFSADGNLKVMQDINGKLNTVVNRKSPSNKTPTSNVSRASPPKLNLSAPR